MPKLDLTAARRIKGPWGEARALKGPGFSWVKPDPAPAWHFKLPYNISPNLVLEEVDYSRSHVRRVRSVGIGRSFISWQMALAVGQRISFSWRSNTPVFVRVSDRADLTLDMQDLLQSATGQGDIVQREIIVAGVTHFGLIHPDRAVDGTTEIFDFVVE